MTYKIMIVDDEPANLRVLERIFRHDYQVLSASSGEEALRLIQRHDIALLITDQRMPGMSGLELLVRTAEMRPHMVRIILTGYTDVNSLVEAINCGQVYKYVTKPWNNEALQLMVSRALQHYETNRAHHELALANQRLASRLQEVTHGFVRAIADALEAKDEYASGHGRRVSGYANAIGRQMGLDMNALDRLSIASFLHDVGKIGTPDKILLKPGALSDEERATMQLHSERGARMIAGIPGMQEVAAAVRHHHENFDGTGYPDNLAGTRIPLAARIIRVADAYDAMTNPRPFRQALSHEEAIELLLQSAVTLFDPEIVRPMSEFEAISLIRRSIREGLCGTHLFVAPKTFDVDLLSFDEMVNEVASDPAKALVVLHRAKTIQPDAQTASLHDACARIGPEDLRALLLAAIERPCSGSEDDESMLEQAENIREHAVRCASAARQLAEHTGILGRDEAYTLGLLHDIGESLLRSLFPAVMGHRRHAAEGESLDREVIAFGVDHAQVGQWVLEACGMPRQLAALVQTHHDIMRNNSPAALLLSMADMIALADDTQKVAALDALGSERLGMLKLSRADLAKIYANASTTVERYLLV